MNKSLFAYFGPVLISPSCLLFSVFLQAAVQQHLNASPEHLRTQTEAGKVSLCCGEGLLFARALSSARIREERGGRRGGVTNPVPRNILQTRLRLGTKLRAVRPRRPPRVPAGGMARCLSSGEVPTL